MTNKYFDMNQLLTSMRVDPLIDNLTFTRMKQHLEVVAPFADVKPVIHAHWCVVEGTNAPPHCSACGIVPKSKCKEKYCPECGAIMDEGKIK